MEKSITVTVKQVDGESFDITIDANAPLKKFREVIAEKMSIDISAFKLIYIGKLLKDDEKTLEELEIKDGVSIFVLKTQSQQQSHPQETQPRETTEAAQHEDNGNDNDNDIPRLVSTLTGHEPIIVDVRVGNQNGNETGNVASVMSEVLRPLLQNLGSRDTLRQNGDHSSQRVDLASTLTNAVSSFASRLTENLSQINQGGNVNNQNSGNSSRRIPFASQRITIRTNGQSQSGNTQPIQPNPPSNPLSVGIAVPLTDACDAICKEGHIISERASSASLLGRIIDEDVGRHTENSLLRFISQCSDRGDRINSESFNSLLSLVKNIKERDQERSAQRNGTGRFSEVERMARNENGSVSISYVAPAFRSFANSLLSIALLSHSIAGLAENQSELNLEERIIGTASLRSLYRSLTLLSHASAALNHVVAKVDFGTNPSDSLEENDLHLFEFANSNNRVRANTNEIHENVVSESGEEQHIESSREHSDDFVMSNGSDDILNSALLEMDGSSTAMENSDQPSIEEINQDRENHSEEKEKEKEKEFNSDDDAALLSALNEESDDDDEGKVEKGESSVETGEKVQSEKISNANDMEEEEEEGNEDDILAKALMDSMNEPQPKEFNDSVNGGKEDSLSSFLKLYEDVIKQDEKKLKTESYSQPSDAYKFGTFEKVESTHK